MCSLGVDPDATQDEAKSACRRQVKRLHPDRFEGGSGSSWLPKKPTRCYAMQCA